MGFLRGYYTGSIRVVLNYRDPDLVLFLQVCRIMSGMLRGTL